MTVRLIAAGTLVALLAGCDSEERVCDFSEVVQMPTYDQAFRERLAQDVDRICGDPAKGLNAEYGSACKFIRDSIELRAKVAATAQE